MGTIYDEVWSEVFGPKHALKASDPASAEAVLAAHGIKRPAITIRAAGEAGLELAAACVVLMAESGGGRMVWGHDGVDTCGIYDKGGPVTKANYLAYRDAVHAGRIGRQGCGDCQLTSADYQDRADRFGGCWDPYANQLSGFIGLGALIRQYGTRDGFRRYNGAGPAAESYADRCMSQLLTWRQRLSSCKEIDLTDEESQKLDDLHELVKNTLVPVVQWMYGQFAGLGQDGKPAPFPEVPGWPTLPGGTVEDLSFLDFGRRANVQLAEVSQAVQQVLAKLGEQQPAGPVGITISNEDAVRVAQTVIAALGGKLTAGV